MLLKSMFLLFLLTTSAEEIFDLLGLPTTADFKTITTQYRKKSLLFHPDKGGDVGAFQRLSSAYSAYVNGRSAPKKTAGGQLRGVAADPAVAYGVAMVASGLVGSTIEEMRSDNTEVIIIIIILIVTTRKSFLRKLPTYFSFSFNSSTLR